MLELKKGADILAEAGGVATIAEARDLFQRRLDAENLAKLDRITTEEALLKIANAISLCKPDAVVVVTGSPADMQRIREMSIAISRACS